ncbi:unnamed protein product [Thelazia callipaeda]|uniref:Serine/threonine-protein kinase kinX n=1 Tax=Thelazia callipaeda TaxID=103827 RepID=A0A0N5D2B9_THECL|nr:unnamed protein product [Thelazia callipaeda]
MKHILPIVLLTVAAVVLSNPVPKSDFKENNVSSTVETITSSDTVENKILESETAEKNTTHLEAAEFNKEVVASPQKDEESESETIKENVSEEKHSNSSLTEESNDEKPVNIHDPAVEKKTETTILSDVSQSHATFEETTSTPDKAEHFKAEAKVEEKSTSAPKEKEKTGDEAKSEHSTEKPEEQSTDEPKVEEKSVSASRIEQPIEKPEEKQSTDAPEVERKIADTPKLEEQSFKKSEEKQSTNASKKEQEVIDASKVKKHSLENLGGNQSIDAVEAEKITVNESKREEQSNAVSEVKQITAGVSNLEKEHNEKEEKHSADRNNLEIKSNVEGPKIDEQSKESPKVELFTDAPKIENKSIDTVIIQEKHSADPSRIEELSTDTPVIQNLSTSELEKKKANVTENKNDSNDEKEIIQSSTATTKAFEGITVEAEGGEKTASEASELTETTTKREEVPEEEIQTLKSVTATKETQANAEIPKKEEKPETPLAKSSKLDLLVLSHINIHHHYDYSSFILLSLLLSLTAIMINGFSPSDIL